MYRDHRDPLYYDPTACARILVPVDAVEAMPQEQKAIVESVPAATSALEAQHANERNGPSTSREDDAHAPPKAGASDYMPPYLQDKKGAGGLKKEKPKQKLLLQKVVNVGPPTDQDIKANKRLKASKDSFALKITFSKDAIVKEKSKGKSGKKGPKSTDDEGSRSG